VKQLDRVLKRLLAEVEGVIICNASHADVHRPEGVDGDGRAPEEERLALDQRRRSSADGDAALEIADHQIQGPKLP
jgi:hypothetical protein